MDTYTSVPYSGNPCVVVLDAASLTSNQMLRIAREFNLSETAFCMASNVADIRARYFTPAYEIPFAGHPTVAVVAALLESGRLPSNRRHVTLEIGKAIIDVGISRTGSARWFCIAQRSPIFQRKYPREAVAPCLTLSPGQIAGQPQTVSTGLPQLMVQLRNRHGLDSVFPDLDLLGNLKANGDFYSVHTFVLDAAASPAQTHSRHFSLPPGPLEDPFTGSATGAMASYLINSGLLTSPEFVARQGEHVGRPGLAKVKVEGGNPIRAVEVAGQAVVMGRGRLVPPKD